jgi:3-oxoacyl-[acyl-carrier-protein] synthase-1
VGAVITAVAGMTAIGFSVPAISAAIRAPVSGFTESQEYSDSNGEPIIVAELPLVENITDDLERDERLRTVARHCLADLIETFLERSAQRERVCLYVGLPVPDRPGPSYLGAEDELQAELLPILQAHFGTPAIRFIESGNPSAIEALDEACRLLAAQPNTICIIGGIDSLLDPETLDFFEDDARLKSASYGRSHGLVPGEGVGFFVLESAEFAARRGRRPLAEILGTGLSHEPAPLHSLKPSKLTGLTEACRMALRKAQLAPEAIGAVIGDLNGEFLRHKEWAFAEVRCFGPAREERIFWHPADCFGDIGAASGALLIAFGTSLYMRRSLATNPILCFCSDDEALRGAVVIGPPGPMRDARGP